MSRAFEAKPDNPAIRSLVRLHADLGAQIQANKTQSEKLDNDMRAVEAVIQIGAKVQATPMVLSAKPQKRRR